MGMNQQLVKVNRLKDMLSVPSVMQQFQDSLGENAGAFTASLVELLSSDNQLQQCDPRDLIVEALKAASLKLPINKSLGFAWIIARKISGVLRPVFQIGYRGYYQLAQRTGLYRFINTRTIPAGSIVNEDFKTGELSIILPKEPVEGNPVGYFACFVQLNGYSKEMFKSYDWMLAHVKEYVYGWDKEYSPWYGSGFHEMAEKTMGSRILSKYGILSIEYLHSGIGYENRLSASQEASMNENTKEFDILPENVNPETGEVIGEAETVEEKVNRIPAEFD
jgi:recombination protein RecT